MSAGLESYQAINRHRTVRRVRTAMSVIAAHTKKHGFYPFNGGQVTRIEVCRVAGVGASTLKNKTHADTNAMVMRWLKRLSKRAPTRKPAAADSKAAKIAQLTNAWEATARRFNEFKIRYDELAAQNADLQRQVVQLRADLTRLGGTNVVPLAKRKKGS